MTWYTAKTSGDQGLIIEEETGRNVAVVYDKKDAPLLAAAPELLQAVKEILDYGVWIARCKDPDCGVCSQLRSAERRAWAAIEKCEAEI